MALLPARPTLMSEEGGEQEKGVPHVDDLAFFTQHHKRQGPCILS